MQGRASELGEVEHDPHGAVVGRQRTAADQAVRVGDLERLQGFRGEHGTQQQQRLVEPYGNDNAR